MRTSERSGVVEWGGRGRGHTAPIPLEVEDGRRCISNHNKLNRYDCARDSRQTERFPHTGFVVQPLVPLVPVSPGTVPVEPAGQATAARVEV